MQSLLLSNLWVKPVGCLSCNRVPWSEYHITLSQGRTDPFSSFDGFLSLQRLLSHSVVCCQSSWGKPTKSATDWSTQVRLFESAGNFALEETRPSFKSILLLAELAASTSVYDWFRNLLTCTRNFLLSKKSSSPWNIFASKYRPQNSPRKSRFVWLIN